MRSKLFIDSIDYPHAGWWRTKAERARDMTLDELWFSRRDCNEAADVVVDGYGKYKDEATIYAAEIQKRERKN